MDRRGFLTTVSALGAALAFPSPALIARGANENIRCGLVGVGGRGSFLAQNLVKVPHATLAAICDPDSSRLNAAGVKYPEAVQYKDMRELYDNSDIDVAIIATCNHWHCLAAIWAMQAGKHAYVEKPLCMSFYEGRQVVNAAKKYKKFCQIGTQMRTDMAHHREAKKFLHEDKILGDIKSVRVNRYQPRPSIGLRTTPLEIPASVDYNLWLGPAPEVPLYRNNLQYDWHWMWRTGHGEAGNWGAHLLDDCRNDALCGKVRFPKRVLVGGARIGYNDAGETPNSVFAFFDTGYIPVVFTISNLPDKQNPRSAGVCPGPTSGYIVYCEGGRYEKRWGSAIAFDKDGQKIRDFNATSERDGAFTHLDNYVNALYEGDESKLSAQIQIGYDSASWYNSLNAAYRLARPYSKKEALAVQGTDGLFADTIADLEAHLSKQGLKMDGDTFKMSDFLEIDQENECFKGDLGNDANELMNIQYRSGFAIPEIKV